MEAGLPGGGHHCARAAPGHDDRQAAAEGLVHAQSVRLVARGMHEDVTGSENARYIRTEPQKRDPRRERGRHRDDHPLCPGADVLKLAAELRGGVSTGCLKRRSPSH